MQVGRQSPAAGPTAGGGWQGSPAPLGSARGRDMRRKTGAGLVTNATLDGAEGPGPTRKPALTQQQASRGVPTHAATSLFPRTVKQETQDPWINPPTV